MHNYLFSSTFNIHEAFFNYFFVKGCSIKKKVIFVFSWQRVGGGAAKLKLSSMPYEWPRFFWKFEKQIELILDVLKIMGGEVGGNQKNVSKRQMRSTIVFFKQSLNYIFFEI